MVDDHHAATGESAGERDPSGAGGPDHLPPVPEQVHAPVTGAPRGGGWVEAAHDLGPGCEGPGAAVSGAEQHDEGDEEGDGGGHGATVAAAEGHDEQARWGWGGAGPGSCLWTRNWLTPSRLVLRARR